MGRDVYELIGEGISVSGHDAAELIRLWERETILSPLGPYVDVTELDRANHDTLASWFADVRGRVGGLPRDGRCRAATCVSSTRTVPVPMSRKTCGATPLIRNLNVARTFRRCCRGD